MRVIVIAGELTLGVLEGIALGVVVSLLTLIYVTSHPTEQCSANFRDLPQLFLEDCGFLF
jgi:hypothetical protein